MSYDLYADTRDPLKSDVWIRDLYLCNKYHCVLYINSFAICWYTGIVFVISDDAAYHLVHKSILV